MRRLCLALLMVVAGCGGGGNGTTPVEPLLLVVNREIAAVNSENINALMSCFSLAYMDGCIDYQQTHDDWADIFNTPTLSVHLSNLQVISMIRDDLNGVGQMEATYTQVVNNNGVIHTTQMHGIFYMRKEAGLWLDYGNQQCPMAKNALLANAKNR